MREFTDKNGRVWSITINLGSAKRVFEKAGIDLLNPSTLIGLDDNGIPIVEKSPILQAISDDLLIASIITTLVEKQIKERNISVEDFEDSFDGETLKKASEAFLEEYHSFFTARGNFNAQKMVKIVMNLQKLSMTESLQQQQQVGETSLESQEESESKTSTITPGSSLSSTPTENKSSSGN